MTWIDISMPIRPGATPLWPGSPEIRFEPRLRIEAGDPVNDSTLHLGVHTGTHIDAPWHHLPGGARSEAIDLASCCGPCFVADLRGHRRLTASALAATGIPAGVERLLLLTDNSAEGSPDFAPDFVGLDAGGARALSGRGLRLLGSDYLSVQAYGADDAVHRVLLSEGVLLLEGLRLQGVAAGPYELFCAPLALVGLEGAPARALLRPIEAGKTTR